LLDFTQASGFTHVFVFVSSLPVKLSLTGLYG